MDRRTTPRRPWIALGLGAALLAGTGAVGLASCEFVLGTLPPVGDGGPGAGGTGSGTGAAGGGAGATTGASTTSGGGGGACPGGETRCNGPSGGSACADLQSDPAHCGTCTIVCAAPVSETMSGKAACKTGQCDADCNTTTPRDCPVMGGAGHACVDTTTDPQFCGGCSGCAGGETCDAGACAPIACSPGLSTCSSACVNLASDPSHCGVCTKSCLGLPCLNGTCAVQVGCGMTSCGAACVDTTKDPAHCGSCAKACAKDEVCLAGSCAAYVPASDCWECALLPAMSKCCSVAGQTVCTAAACQ